MIFHKLKIKNINYTATNAVLVDFYIPKKNSHAYKYKSGQHLTIKSSYKDTEYRRSYSICNNSDDSLQVGIRDLDRGFSHWAFSNLKESDELSVMQPYGTFTLKEDSANQVFFAAGCGITPIISMIRQALENTCSTVSLFYGNKSINYSMFIEELSFLKNQYMNRLNLYFLFSQEKQDIEWLNGRLDKEKIQQIYDLGFLFNSNVNYYSCGPSQMIADISSVLSEYVDKKYIHFENFGTDIKPVKVKKVSAQTDDYNINIKFQGKSNKYQGDSATILEAGLGIKLDLPYACTSGVCGTCRCKLIKGDVEMINNFALEDYELERGYILSCQSIPKNKETEVDFDV